MDLEFKTLYGTVRFERCRDGCAVMVDDGPARYLSKHAVTELSAWLLAPDKYKAIADRIFALRCKQSLTPEEARELYGLILQK